MELSRWLVAGIVELYLVLLLLCVFLLFNIKSLRKLVRSLRDKVKNLLDELNQARSDNRELIEQKALAELKADPAPNFRDQLQKQIDLTQEFHDELPGSQTIDRYLDPIHPIQRQSLALRHAVLSAELEAQDADGDVHPNWALLQKSFGGLINFYKEKFSSFNKPESTPSPETSPAPEPALNTGISTDEQCVTDLLIEAAGGMAPDNLEVLLERYRSSAVRKDPDELPANTPAPTKASPDDSAQDLANLRALAEKQRQTILELQKRIQSTAEPVDLKNLVEDLNGQLNRQSQFMKESESCIRLLENELEMANAKIEQLKHQKRTPSDTETPSKSERQELTQQNEQLRKRVKQQDAEIEQLIAQLQMSSKEQ